MRPAAGRLGALPILAKPKEEVETVVEPAQCHIEVVHLIVGVNQVSLPIFMLPRAVDRVSSRDQITAQP